MNAFYLSVLGLSRILQIARVAKYRQQFTPNHIETKDLMHKPSQGNIGSNFNQVDYWGPGIPNCKAHSSS